MTQVCNPVAKNTKTNYNFKPSLVYTAGSIPEQLGILSPKEEKSSVVTASLIPFISN